jgi:hypothetical protein
MFSLRGGLSTKVIVANEIGGSEKAARSNARSET